VNWCWSEKTKTDPTTGSGPDPGAPGAADDPPKGGVSETLCIWVGPRGFQIRSRFEALLELHSEGHLYKLPHRPHCVMVG